MKEEYKNLFEAAAKLSKPKRDLSKAELSYDELNKAYDRCKTMYEEINSGIEFAFLYAKVEPHVLHTFLSHQQNFSQADWRAVQEGKTQVEQMLRNLHQQINSEHVSSSSAQADVVTSQSQVEQESASQPPVHPKEVEQKNDQKKPRHIHRRNQWLDMR